MKSTTVIPFPVLYRGFCVTENVPQETELIVKHRRVLGSWFTGYYLYTESNDKHWIIDQEKGIYVEVLPETIGLLEPESGRFCGDVCYFQNEIRGILRFGHVLSRGKDGRGKGLP